MISSVAHALLGVISCLALYDKDSKIHGMVCVFLFLVYQFTEAFFVGDTVFVELGEFIIGFAGVVFLIIVFSFYGEVCR